MNTINGMVWILLGIATLGLLPALWQNCIHWEPPPNTEQMRGSRQRRVRPKNYPWPDKTEEMVEKELLACFSWYERLYLFWTCPVVLFHTDKIICVCINLMFTFWFVAHRQAVNPDAVAADVGGLGEHSITLIPFKVSSNLDIEPLQGVEIALCIYYGCSFVREITEILCELDDWEILLRDYEVPYVRLQWFCDKCYPFYYELKKYISSFWNVLDISEIVAFLAGICYRVTMRDLLLRNGGGGTSPPQTTPTPDEQEYKYKDEEWTNWSLAYGACLFIAWFRVLRSCYALPKTSKTFGFCVSRFLYP
jgi:hypothetical protein